MNEILNGLNMNDKKWNFTKALITKALEMGKGNITKTAKLIVAI